MRRWTGLALLAGCAVLAGCATQKSPSGTMRYSVDFRGAAKSCTAPSDLKLAGGKTTDAAITLANDGGWCAISVDRDDRPYDAGLLTAPPAHGKVYIHKVGDVTRIDYTPDRGFVGADRFTLKLVPTDAVLTVAANVTK
jgi:hypothetical protein